MTSRISRIPFGLALGASTAALAAALLVGCGQGTKAGYTLTDGQVDVDGKTLMVTLDVDHAAGLEWEEEVSGDGLALDSVTHGDDSSGATDTFTFTGSGAGEQTITLTCEGTDAAETKTVTVETKTDNSGQITESHATGSDGSSGSTQG